MKPYNTYLDGMISNYRDEAKQVGLETKHLTNKEVYALIQEIGILESNEEEVKWFLDLLKQHQPKNNNL